MVVLGRRLAEARLESVDAVRVVEPDEPRSLGSCDVKA